MSLASRVLAGRRRSPSRWAVAGSVLLLAGCGSSPSPGPTAAAGSSGATSTAATVLPAVTASVPAGTQPPPVPSATADVEVARPAAKAAAVLTAIRVARQDGYDRVVLEFDRPFGGYSAGYVPGVTRDPSDDPVQLRGKAFLRVVLKNATTDNGFQAGRGGIAPAHYRGPLAYTPMLPAVQEIAEAGDFEATLSFGLGLTARTGFRVQVLQSPARLVIDVTQPS